MLRYYDVKCKSCGEISEQFIDTKEGFDKCKCGGDVERIYSKFTFKLLYDNKKDTVGWSYNNYERSRYWDDIKKERAKGRDVRPINEK